MSFPFTIDLADYTPTFPGAAFTPLEVKNKNDFPGYSIVAESFAVPASADGDGLYRVNLDQIPLEQSSVAITVDGGARTVVPINEAPSAGQVALSVVDGSMIFHSSDAGLTGAATYTGRGTPIMAHHLHMLQKELAAVEGWLIDGSLVEAIEAGIDGVDSVTFTLDKDNAGAGAGTVSLLFNRGTTGADVGLVWNETTDSFSLQLIGAGTLQPLSIGNLTASGGTFSGDVDAVNLVLSGTLTGFTNVTGTGNIVRATSPTLVTPILGAATGTSLDVSSFVDGAGGFRVNGTEIISAAFALDNISNDTGSGDFVRATSPTLVTPNIGAAIGTSLDVSSFVDAEDGFRVGGTTVIDDARELSVVTGEVTGALTVGSLSSSGSISGTTGSFAGNVTLSGLSRRINLSAWTGSSGEEGRIVFDTTEDGDTYMGEIATDHIGFTCGATLAAFISRFEFRPSVPLREAYAGTATAPHYSFQADTNSGMFTSGADLLSFATGGVRAGGWDASQNFDVVGAQLTLGGIPIIRGAGDPESSVTAPVGSLYLRTDGSTSTTLYVKESGAGNTGWAAK